MRRPEFVYFDLGNVLLYFDHGIAARSMAKLIGVQLNDNLLSSAPRSSTVPPAYLPGVICSVYNTRG